MPTYVTATSSKPLVACLDLEDWHKGHLCPETGTGQRLAHKWLLSAANACRHFGLSQEQAADWLEANMSRQPDSGREIPDQVAAAYGAPVGERRPKNPTPEFNLELLKGISARVPIHIDSNWLYDHSSQPVSGVKPSEFLDVIYQSGEMVFATISQKSKNGYIYRVGDSLEADGLNEFVKDNIDGAWFLSCPVNGEIVNGSIRSEPNLTSFRFAVVESDVAKVHRDLWLRALVQLRLPILAVYESGSNPPSIHALIRVGAESKKEFEEIVQAGIKPLLVPVGACPGAFSAVRLTRLPGVIRRDNGREQTLLYLAPNAEQKAILEQ